MSDITSLKDGVVVGPRSRNMMISVVDNLHRVLNERIRYHVATKLNMLPQKLSQFENAISSLRNTLQHPQQALVQLSLQEAGLLKRALLEKSRQLAAERDQRLRETSDPSTRDELQQAARVLVPFMEGAWFEAVEATSLPRLTDFLNLRSAYEAIASAAQERGQYALTRESQFDEKFGILQAPTRFLSDLAYYRQECGLRGNWLSAAFIDVDHFKTLNTRYTETIVDRDILPQLMFTVEAHVYGRGHAYRQGGDEYLVLLPNSSRDEAARILSVLQIKLHDLHFGDHITDKLTTSIGLYY